ncbi:FAD synthase [Dendroctonus ponderosae]|uniref:FAD synthase n=1 Tax=Dendroctonus ponderosae TaxID=77166 RepID=UPI0020365149|nr:FAD synthase [Dendroctonus ponderosae]
MSSKWLRRIAAYARGNCNVSTEKGQKIPCAGIVVIGDEILKGEVFDTNSTFLAKELHRLGLKLKKISVVSDDVQEIGDEIRLFSKTFDYVLTTGGIGPTHDDVTYEGVALAFNEPLVLHPELKDICCEFYRTTDPLSAGMKLAYIPRSSRLHYKTVSGANLSYPNVSVKNVYMFPGIPELLKKTVSEVGPLLFRSNKRFFTRAFYCNVAEYRIITELQQVVDEFPSVQFGCYPKLHHSIYQVKITVESCCEDSTSKAYERLKELIPAHYIVDVED